MFLIFPKSRQAFCRALVIVSVADLDLLCVPKSCFESASSSILYFCSQWCYSVCCWICLLPVWQCYTCLSFCSSGRLSDLSKNSKNIDSYWFCLLLHSLYRKDPLTYSNWFNFYSLWFLKLVQEFRNSWWVCLDSHQNHFSLLFTMNQKKGKSFASISERILGMCLWSIYQENDLSE